MLKTATSLSFCICKSNVESALEENDTVTSVWAKFENIARKHSEFSRSAILMLTALVASNSMK